MSQIIQIDFYVFQLAVNLKVNIPVIKLRQILESDELFYQKQPECPGSCALNVPLFVPLFYIVVFLRKHFLSFT